MLVVAAFVGIAAGEIGGSGEGRTRQRDRLSGSVAIDGSPSLRNLLDRAAAQFERRHPDVRITVGASGDERAIDLFCAGEVDLASVARRLDRAERRDCRSSGTRYQSAEVARAPIAVVVSNRNTFVSCLRIDQLRAIWRRTAPATNWSESDPRLPAVSLDPVGWRPDAPPAMLLAEALFGPVDPLLRDDYRVAADADELLRTVAASPGSVGFLPVTQLKRGSGVRAVPVDAGSGCVAPSVAAVRNGSYRPLSRPLGIDLRTDVLKRPEVRRFVGDFLARPPALTAADGAVPVKISPRVYRKFTRR
jgi:phosphate transport system substrate-binding protein